MKYLRCVIPVLLVFCACKPPETPIADTASTAAATDTTATTPPPPPLDHFKFWKVKSQPATGTVFLKSTLDGAEWPATLVSIEYLGNPTDKRHGGIDLKIGNQELHYVMYAITKPESDPPRGVKFTNQFGTADWNIDQPRWLLVPAGKSLTPNPPDAPKADHFVCYNVEGTVTTSIGLFLADQFDRVQSTTHVESFDELVSHSFCVPAQKRVETTTNPIIDPAMNLALYRLRPPNAPYTVTAWTKDQFGPRQLETVTGELLGVPSKL